MAINRGRHVGDARLLKDRKVCLIPRWNFSTRIANYINGSKPDEGTEVGAYSEEMALEISLIDNMSRISHGILAYLGNETVDI